MAQFPNHWWDSNTAAYDAVVDLKDVGPDYPREEATWKAWESILPMYFPAYAATPGGDKYLIRRTREKGRGSLAYSPTSTRHEGAVVKLSNTRLDPDGCYRATWRDILWVECEAPNHDTPDRWNSLMTKAVGNLEEAHPDRDVWVILAVGLKWMVFYWNPSERQSPQLSMCGSNGMGTWAVDTRVHVAPISGQRHITSEMGIETKYANSLEFWTLDRGSSEPQNLTSCLHLLEEIFRRVQTYDYHGENPSRAS